jgi:glycosyltransferase involved in cell wall biosynthesis
LKSRAQRVLVGEGPERETIVEAAKLMGIEDKLVLPGFLPEPHRYIGLFDVFSLTSQSEQAPISVIEAMAAGLPVVAPWVGDIPNMVDPLNEPYLSPTRYELFFRDRFEFLAQKPETAKLVGEANRKRARALFHEDQMIAAYAALYGEAMGRPGVLG